MTALSGLYLHIPFCHSKCTYCSFITGGYEDLLAKRYLNALAVEIRAAADRLDQKDRKADTIYFGGGTPSIIAPEEIAHLIEICREAFDVAPEAEITAEMNPSDLDPARLRAFRQAGINRASVGIQSFIEDQLKAMGRDHSVEDALCAAEKLRAVGFDDISIDLIAGLPDQTREQWEYNLSRAFGLAPNHMSIYLLEIKEGTTLYAQIKSGRFRSPDEDLAADMYEMLLDRAAACGYEHYEISNFAAQSPDLSYRSRHNTKYWTDAPYYGFGVSAHSYDGCKRYWNETSTHNYISRIEQSGEAVADRLQLSREDRAREAFMLNLRLMEGADLRLFQERHDVDFRSEYEKQFEELREAGLIETNGDILKLTRRGILLSNEVFQLFI